MFDNLYDMFLYGFRSVLEWMHIIQYDGWSLLGIATFGLLLTLLWRFFFSPIFGASGGSMNVNASDVVRKFKSGFSKQKNNSGKEK